MVNTNELFKTLYDSNYSEAFMLGVMKIRPKERKVFFDHHFIEISGFDHLTSDEWVDLDSTGIIEFLKTDNNLYGRIREIFNGVGKLEMESVDFVAVNNKHVQVKVLINSRHDDGVPVEIVAVFIDATYVEEKVREFNKLSAIFEASQDISRASTWWVDYDEDPDYFYQSDNGAVAAGLKPAPDKRYSIQEYVDMRAKAAEMDEDYRLAVEAETESFTKAWTGETDDFGGRTPLLTPQGNIVWTDSLGRVVLRKEDGTPKLVVAVDIFVNDIVEKEAEIFKLQGLIDEGLKNSNIGVWWNEYKDGHHVFHQTNSYKRMMGIDSLLEEDNDSEVWYKYIQDFKANYPMYNSYLDEDAKLFSDCLNGVIDEYQSILPVLANGEIKWIEVRATSIKKSDDGKAALIVGVNVDVTERLANEQIIKDLERRNFALNNANRTAIETAGLLVWTNDRVQVENNTKYYVNSLYAETLGIEIDNDGMVDNKNYFDTIYPDEEGEDGYRILSSKALLMYQGKIENYFGVIVKHRNLKTKETVYLEHNGYIQERDNQGNVLVAAGYIRDFTEQILIERENKELNVANERLRKADSLAIKSGQVMVWYQDNDEFDGSMKFFGNDVYREKLGLEVQDDGLISLSDFRKSIYRLNEEGYTLSREMRELDDKLDRGELESYEKIRVLHKNLKTGKMIYLDHYCEVESRYEDGYIKSKGGFMIDVTDTVESQRKIEFLANRDRLTGLYNRNYFEEYVHRKLPVRYSIIVFDLDGLKLINDTFGHLEGDKVIKFAADLVHYYFNEDSMVARIGGDEFAVVSKVINEEKIIERYNLIKQKVQESNESNSFDIAISYGHQIVLNGEFKYETAFAQAENLMYRRKLTERRSRKSVTLDSIIETLNARTEETKEHGERLAKYAIETLKELGFSRVAEQEDMALLARVHDVGKITIPEHVMFKPSSLTLEEYEIMKSHSESGYKIVRNIVDSDVIADGVLHHHERWDGKGYPMGLQGEEIPLYARIISVTDAYDVMTNGRPYALPISKEEAIQELKDCSGSQFDEKVVNAFIKVLDKSDT